MNLRRWIALGLLAGALAVLQMRGLERQRETLEENQFTHIADLPAGDFVPTYVASLLFGSFRAVAIDILWIQLKRIEEEKRWYERREVLKLISYFQPRNPEVWAHLGWHSAFNVANGFTDEDSRRWTRDSRAWDWTRFGLEWLIEGTRRLPDSAYLKHEIGWTLFFKPVWRRHGWLDTALLERIEAETELQELLQGKRPIERPLSAFELAVEWYDRARADLERARKEHHLTQMGLYIYPSTLDGYAHESEFYQAMYLWRKGRDPEAKEWFLRARDRCARMVREYGASYSPIARDYADFYGRLPGIVDHFARVRAGEPGADRKAVQATIQALVETNPFAFLDREFLWDDQNPDAPLNLLKRRMSRNLDPNECNDDFKLARPVAEGQLVQGNIEPEGFDVDYHRFALEAPGRPAPGADPRPPSPIPVRIRFGRPEGARLDFRVTVHDADRNRIREEEVRGDRFIEFAAARYGWYVVKVEALAPVAPWPDDTRYHFQYAVSP